jgi:hypothetical protein
MSVRSTLLPSRMRPQKPGVPLGPELEHRRHPAAARRPRCAQRAMASLDQNVERAWPAVTIPNVYSRSGRGQVDRSDAPDQPLTTSFCASFISPRFAASLPQRCCRR